MKRMLSIRKSLAGLSLVAIALLFTVFARAAAGQDAAPRLGAGDRVHVTVYGHEDLSGEFEVNPMGELTLPLVQNVPVQGLTLAQAEQRIIDKLQPDYLVKPRVTIQLLSFRPFYILGEVNNPGSYQYSGGMTVVNAVALAGGYTHRARVKRITIQRTVEGEQIEIPATEEMQIMPGDVIDVPERFF